MREAATPTARPSAYTPRLQLPPHVVPQLVPRHLGPKPGVQDRQGNLRRRHGRRDPLRNVLGDGTTYPHRLIVAACIHGPRQVVLWNRGWDARAGPGRSGLEGRGMANRKGGVT
jgi:hypothetical protein